MNMDTALKSKYWLWFYRSALALLGIHGLFYVIYGTHFGYQVCFVRHFPAIHDLDLVDQMEKRALRTLDESPSNPKYERAKKLVVDLSVAQRQCVQRNGFDDCKEVLLGERTKKLSFTGSGRNGALGASGIEVKYFEYRPDSKVEFTFVIDHPGCWFREDVAKWGMLE